MSDEKLPENSKHWPPFYLPDYALAGNEGGESLRETQKVLAAYGQQPPVAGKQFDAYVPVLAEVVTPGEGADTTAKPVLDEPAPRNVMWPVVLFVATCWSTYHAGQLSSPNYPMGGFLYAGAVMFILTAHELGHFFQTLRYRIPASFPMFIPMPISPLGTMGAVIGMAPGEGDRKALFDVAVSGPLAGLVPSLICCVWGLYLSHVVPMEVALAQGADAGPFIGTPLVFEWIRDFVFGQLPAGTAIDLHPIAFAGWVGLLITALNLFPIGQLDGGHTLYALLGKKAHIVARLTWAGCFAAIVVSQNWGWSLMLGLLWMMGTDHPPTANDAVPLGTTRKIIGWALLLFVPIGFTPTPFISLGPAPVQQRHEDGRIVLQQPLKSDLQMQGR